MATVGDRLGVDLWDYQSGDGASMRGALDWLLPFAVGDKRWPYDQIKKPKTSHLYKILRRAAIAYHEPRYDALVSKFLDDDSEAELVDLLYPRLSIISSSASSASIDRPAKPKKVGKNAKNLGK